MAQTVQLFKALADETRLRILNLLAQQELCVCDIMNILKIGQSKISRHLTYLKNAGWVTGRRDGLWMHYALVTHAGGVQQELVAWLAQGKIEIPGGTTDLAALKLMRVRGKLCTQLSKS